jgi:hypothetical protein
MVGRIWQLVFLLLISILINAVTTTFQKHIILHCLLSTTCSRTDCQSPRLLPQITMKKIREINWEKCFKEVVLGYFLKMVVGDSLKDFTFWIAIPYFEGEGFGEFECNALFKFMPILPSIH